MAHVSFPKPVARVRLRQKYQAERDADWRNAKREVWLRDEGRCRVCHKRVLKGVDSLERGEVHHIVPRSRLSKGKHAETSNLVLLCVAHHKDAQAYRIFFKGNANAANFTIEKGKEPR